MTVLSDEEKMLRKIVDQKSPQRIRSLSNTLQPFQRRWRGITFLHGRIRGTWFSTRSWAVEPLARWPSNLAVALPELKSRRSITRLHSDVSPKRRNGEVTYEYA